ncbi:MAG: flap endonuclease [Deltaproteobacteria bacterium]|nr:MAG: flap endonuclease [Deltaproteobacteria bacterium]
MDVHLIDGTFELFRVYFGAPEATAPDGREVGATRGLLRSWAAFLDEPGVTHVAAAFDTEIESFRNGLFDGYKTGEGIDPALHSQFPLAERAAYALGIVGWPMIEHEADDGLATGAARYADDPRVGRLYICTPDKDLMQCVRGEKVVTWDRRKDVIYGFDGVREKFGIEPESIPDYLALVGDTADGIPGVPRWGAKSTAAVLAHYKHLEAIPDDAADWGMLVRGAKTLADNLASMRPEAALYKKLATLRTDAPIEETLDDLEWKGARRDALEELCAELGERGIPRRIKRFRED